MDIWSVSNTPNVVTFVVTSDPLTIHVVDLAVFFCFDVLSNPRPVGLAYVSPVPECKILIPFWGLTHHHPSVASDGTSEEEEEEEGARRVEKSGEEEDGGEENDEKARLKWSSHKKKRSRYSFTSNSTAQSSDGSRRN
ncbi:hypothetical protein Bca52824_027567 [Brassica carinata]|uniref:Uncharacterized protein n=1 Tax=Brassica carinata TaxID=52824 RepID=A0A8X7VAR5_BRACI|nr:hypothetical protein Bca52824_027567 [Brassica carinata]